MQENRTIGGHFCRSRRVDFRQREGGNTSCLKPSEYEQKQPERTASE
jgi:hypothetical protein